MSVERPKVSIIVPIYNVEKYIERCAVSLFEQTYDNIEYVFVNDCSPDQSVDVLRQVLSRYPQRSSQAKIINHDRNRGVAASRNTALEHCTGEFVIHADPDDYIELDAVETLVAHQEKSNLDIVTGQMIMHTKAQDVLLPFPKYSNKEVMVIDMMQPTIMHSLANRLIKRSLFQDYNIRTEVGVNCGEDCWMMTRLAYYAESFDTIDKVVYHYDCTREHSYTANKKGVVNKKKLKDDITTAQLIVDFFRDKEQVYFDEANRVAVKSIEVALKRAAGAWEHDLFNEMCAKLMASDKKYWDAIGWDNGFKRLVSQHYHSCRAALFLSRIYHNTLSYKN